MKLPHRITGALLAALIALPLFPTALVDAGAANTFQNSDFIETEQPELSEQTKQLISLYQRTPTEENYLNLRDMVIENYNAVLARKEEKLAELKEETAGKPGGESIVAEMEEIVQEMYLTYWDHINSSMLRFTDPRLLQWRVTDAPQYAYIPVMGAGESIYVKRTPVTNAEYAVFLSETGTEAPSNWTNGAYPSGEDDYPVNFVSYDDAQAYCAWLTEQDGVNTYRLPSESEWELAAGHMPKDADFNCGVGNGRTPVDQYEGITRGAHGAIDFWGNVWEWTSTVRSDTDGAQTLAVKGGSWCSDRTECRTEHRKEGRDAATGYEDVGFRVIQVKNGEEPAQKIALATLDAPVVSVAAAGADSIRLSWQSVEQAVAYQLFEYDEGTGLFRMLDTVTETAITIDQLTPGSTHSYLVQPISYAAICDNVSPENCVTATCGENGVFDLTDMPADAYYAEAVTWAAQNGLTDSISTTAFDPERTCTRAQLLTFLWRAFDAPTPTHTAHSFTDIAADATYSSAVLWAVEQGITTGTTATTFDPDGAVDRGQAVTFLYRAAGTPSVEATAPFTDVAHGAYYENAVLWAVAQQITTGTTATTFSPAEPCTQGQVVTFLYRFSTGTTDSMVLHETGEINYWLYTPSGKTDNMPLIVYLHGITGKGDDPQTLLTLEGFAQWLSDGTLGEIPAYVLIPQLAADKRDWGAVKDTVASTIQQVAANHPIDSGNISLTGFSMGAAGVWQMAVAYPELFRCIAPCSGGLNADQTALSVLSDMNIWAFVGAEDTVVQPQPTIDFMEQLSQLDPQAKLTILEDAAHTDVPAQVYLSEEIDLIRWLIEK